jgi:photosystem II stability/assembly factor-like uncharacterized protein
MWLTRAMTPNMTEVDRELNPKRRGFVMQNWRRTKQLKLWFVGMLILITALAQAASVSLAVQDGAQRYDARLYRAMQWRSIGPFRGGRSVAVCGVPSQSLTYYFGGTGSGVWKTDDAGITWRNISDGFFKTGTVGAIAVAESDPNVVYVGMGETCPRGNVSHGDGVYKSTDAGRTWRNIGLRDSRHISRVRIHPQNPDLVYVAAMGHIFGANQERGVFRSKDGGKTWEKVLFVDDKTGAIDLSVDATNPRILYAATWQALRTPWTATSGGPGSGIHKSTDGGDTWTKLAGGLPRGMMGRIGVAVSPANADRVWALVEADDGGIYRSENGGRTWQLINKDRRFRQRAWYYTHIYADPKDADTVYVLNTGFYKSNDGGRTFDITFRVPHGDNHDLWLNPNNPQYMINANDGGANVSLNAGQSWSPQSNQPTAQFYRVITDGQFPYFVYGAQQDNSTVGIPSRTSGGGIGLSDWYPVGGGESGHIAPTRDGSVVYAGSYGGLITRYDHRTKQLRNITPWSQTMVGEAAKDMKYRFQWNAPILISPHDPKVLYHAAHVLFKSTDEGQSWQEISPDLTRNDKSKQDYSGGPLTRDNTGVEVYGTIFALAESPRQVGVIWTGSDDGLVWVTRNGGKNWENVTPKELPEWGTVNTIDASPHDPATAYVTVHKYRLDDYKPYIFKTSDYGKTWKKITSGIPETDFVRVVREDPARRGLLYAGTETTGVYVSFDDGENWQSLQLNLPVVPIHDLVVKDNDLVAATHGRSFWILDDLTPLHQLTDAVAQADVHLYKPRAAYRMEGGGGGGGGGGGAATVGRNPANGAVVYYYFKQRPQGEVKLEILDPKGAVVQTYSSVARPDAAQPQVPSEFAEFFGGGGGQARVSVDAGMNRFVWNLRYPDPTRVPGAVLWGNIQGPEAVPGTYQVRLTAEGKTLTQPVEVMKDPRISTTPDDYQKQFDLLIQIRDRFSECSETINRLRDVKKQVDELAKRVADLPNGKAIADAAKPLNQKLTAIEEELLQTKNEGSQDALNFPPKLNNQIATLSGAVGGPDARPTNAAYARFEELKAQLAKHVAALQQVLTTDLANFNKLVRDQNITPVIVPGQAAGARR